MEPVITNMLVSGVFVSDKLYCNCTVTTANMPIGTTVTFYVDNLPANIVGKPEYVQVSHNQTGLPAYNLYTIPATFVTEVANPSLSLRTRYPRIKDAGGNYMPSVTNTAAVNFTVAGNNYSKTGQATITVNPDPSTKITVTKTASPTTVTAGNQVTYTVVVKTTGVGAVTAATIVDTIPSGLSFVADSIILNGGPMPGMNINNLTIALPDVGTVTVTYKCTAL